MDRRIILQYTFCFFYKRNVYKYTKSDFWWKIKHNYATKQTPKQTPALICVMN